MYGIVRHILEAQAKLCIIFCWIGSFVRISAMNSASNAQAHGVLNRPANSSIEAPEDREWFPISEVPSLLGGVFPIWLEFFKRIETTIHFQMGHDFFHFPAFNFWYAQSCRRLSLMRLDVVKIPWTEA